MSSTKGVICFIVLLSVLSIAPEARAIWSENGSPVCTATDQQSEPYIVETGDGGWIIVWWDDRSGIDVDIYAQRVSPLGDLMWATGGVPICTAAGDQYRLDVVSDGVGGAIVAWEDYRSGASNADIYVQRINAWGDVQWGADGTPVCTESGHQQFVDLDSDGQGGAVLTWQDERDGPADIYIQHVSSLGTPVWTTNGVVVCNAAQEQWFPQIFTTGAAVSTVTWQDNRGTDADIYAQQFSAGGLAQWTANGVLVCTRTTGQGRPRIAAGKSVLTGSVIVWQEWSGTGWDIWAQRLSTSGTQLWAAVGQPVCTGSADPGLVRLTVTPEGAVVIVWDDDRSGIDYDIYAQKLSSDGAPQWTFNGIVVSAATGNQRYPEMCSDGGNGVIITWEDARSGAYDVYAQRLSSDGMAQWTGGGVAVQADASEASTPRPAPDDTGGAVVAWQFDGDIYAQRIAGSGQWGSAEPVILGVTDVPNDQGGKIQIQWRASALDVLPASQITYYSLWRGVPLISPSSSGPLPEIGAMPAVDSGTIGPVVRRVSEEWAAEWIANIPARYFEAYAYTAVSLYDSIGTDPGWQHFMVTAHTSLQWYYYDSPVDSGYSVDNLSPLAPGGLVAEQSQTPVGLDLSWDGNAEGDLLHYAVYRGTSEGFVPGEGTRIGTPGTPEFFDSQWRWDAGYWYKIAAVDVHGNESAYAVLGPENVTGADVPAVPKSTYLSQNHPNPFTPETRIDFGLAAPARFSLAIYDAAGRLVRVLAADEFPAGRYNEVWDGRDSTGERVASGVYFCRLTTGSFVRTRKMVLLR